MRAPAACGCKTREAIVQRWWWAYLVGCLAATPVLFLGGLIAFGADRMLGGQDPATVVLICIALMPLGWLACLALGALPTPMTYFILKGANRIGAISYALGGAVSWGAFGALIGVLNNTGLDQRTAPAPLPGDAAEAAAQAESGITEAAATQAAQTVEAAVNTPVLAVTLALTGVIVMLIMWRLTLAPRAEDAEAGLPADARQVPPSHQLAPPPGFASYPSLPPHYGAYPASPYGAAWPPMAGHQPQHAPYHQHAAWPAPGPHPAAYGLPGHAMPGPHGAMMPYGYGVPAAEQPQPVSDGRDHASAMPSGPNYTGDMYPGIPVPGVGADEPRTGRSGKPARAKKADRREDNVPSHVPFI